jgi:SagB-type dehydrogenase family enzyme
VNGDPFVPAERNAIHASVPISLESPIDLFDPTDVFHEASKLRRHREDLLRSATRDRALGRLVERSLTSSTGQGSPRRLIARSTLNAERRVLPVGARTSEIAVLGRLARRRQSVRSFAPTAIELADLAEALRMTYGFSGGCVGGEPLLLRRPIPSPGGLYSLELYVVVGRVTCLQRGLYHYEPVSHELSLLRGTEAEDRFNDVLTSLGGVRGCAAYVVVTSVIERLRWKYGPRGYRLAMLEVGHAGQQLCSAVTALGLVGCPIQAFLDDELTELLGIDGMSELPLHVVGIGWPEASSKEDAGPPTPSSPTEERPLEVRSPIANAAIPEMRSWERIDLEMSQAFREIAAGLSSTARARLIALEAWVGSPDATIRDYLRLSEHCAPPELAVEEGVLVHFTDASLARSEDRERLVRALTSVRGEALRFLGLTRAPAVFVEHPSRAPRPLTLLGDRFVQRKVCLPADTDSEGLRHELMHAICAPPNFVIAEGLACLFASGARSIRESELELEDDARDRLLAVFRRRAPGTNGGEALREDDAWLVYPLAGSFLLFLTDRHGRNAVFRYATLLIEDGSEATPAEQESCFQSVFRSSLESAVEEWWASIAKRGPST